ncbi:MAG TPA: NDP-sugar synthase [Egibacteraceae bacterium]|nr:NDP-sugar synthase [Actinomycetota bacterium]HWB70652.1 NDP-sugar synthase [Egibacteraceae bacterium]
MSDVQAVILAGGKGTRLRPVTVDLPKPLVPIANRPLVLHQLRHLAACGVRDVTLALGHGAERFEKIEVEAEKLDISLQLITEPAALGTGGALRWCADSGAFDDRPLFWMNGDVVANPDLDALLELHRDREALLTLWLTSVRDVSQFGVLELDADLRVERFLEKPAPEETDSHLINAGILMLEPKLLQRIPPDTFFSFEQGLLPSLVKEREPVFGLFDGGYWLDSGRPRLYLDANRHVLEGRIDWTPAGEHTEDGLWEGEGVKRDGVSVIRPAVLGDGVTLEDGAQLFGRTVLGRNVTVRSGAELESCVLFDDVEVGRGAEIVESIVCAGARIGDDVVLQDAIVGANAVVGQRNELRHMRLWNDVALDDGVLIVDA